MDTEAILERRRLRRRATFWRAAAFVVFAVALVAAFTLDWSWRTVEGATVRGQVAEIKVDGFINTRPNAVELLKQATDSSAVKAILLRINSPGGAASGGEALFRSVRDAAGKKPVVAVIDGLGASAAYMTAIAADHVIARESAITGSIGVIFQYAHFEELLAKIGAEYEEVKSAPLKGEPSLFQEPNPAAEAMLAAVVEDTYEWFVDLVADRRNLAPATARRLSDGSIYTGRQALTLKLIDQVGGEQEARAWLAAEKQVPEDLPLREWKKDESILSLMTTDAVLGIARLLGLDPGVASLIPERLTVDGLLSVWQAPSLGGSER
jgi:protease-4